MIVSLSFAGKYAVLIAGPTPVSEEKDGVDRNKVWNDTFNMWKTLYFKKGYSDENIIVLFGDGDDYYDTFDGTGNVAPQYRTDYEDYHLPNNFRITDYAATKDNIEGVMNALNGNKSRDFEDIATITENDLLVVWSYSDQPIMGNWISRFQNFDGDSFLEPQEQSFPSGALSSKLKVISNTLFYSRYSNYITHKPLIYATNKKVYHQDLGTNYVFSSEIDYNGTTYDADFAKFFLGFGDDPQPIMYSSYFSEEESYIVKHYANSNGQIFYFNFNNLIIEHKNQLPVGSKVLDVSFDGITITSNEENNQNKVYFFRETPPAVLEVNWEEDSPILEDESKIEKVIRIGNVGSNTYYCILTGKNAYIVRRGNNGFTLFITEIFTYNPGYDGVFEPSINKFTIDHVPAEYGGYYCCIVQKGRELIKFRIEQNDNGFYFGTENRARHFDSNIVDYIVQDEANGEPLQLVVLREDSWQCYNTKVVEGQIVERFSLSFNQNDMLKFLPRGNFIQKFVKSYPVDNTNLFIGLGSGFNDDGTGLNYNYEESLKLHDLVQKINIIPQEKYSKRILIFNDSYSGYFLNSNLANEKTVIVTATQARQLAHHVDNNPNGEVETDGNIDSYHKEFTHHFSTKSSDDLCDINSIFNYVIANNSISAYDEEAGLFNAEEAQYTSFEYPNILYGEITEDKTLSNEVCFIQDITIRSGAKLTLSSGTKIFVKPGIKLVVESGGELAFNGTESEKIIFDCTDPNEKWGGIEIYNASSTYGIHHCDIKNADIGITYYNSTSRFISLYSSNISGCNIGLFSYSSTPIVSKVQFENNNINDIYITGHYSNPYLDKDLRGSYVANKFYGGSNTNKTCLINIGKYGNIRLYDG